MRASLYRSSPVLLLVALAAAPCGCRVRNADTPVTSSATDPAWARDYAGELEAAKNDFTGVEGSATHLIESFELHSAALSRTDAARAQPILDRADAAGRSVEYVQRVERIEVVNAFFALEKDQLGGKVGGAVDYAAKKQGCNSLGAQVVAASALDRAVGQQLQKRLRERNAAHRALESDAALSRDAASLGEAIDDVSYASYLVYVGIVRAEQKLEQLRDESYTVVETLDRAKADAEQRAADAKATEAGRKAAAAQRDEIAKAKGDADREVQAVDALLAETDKRRSALRDAYQAAFARLRAGVGSAAHGK